MLRTIASPNYNLTNQKDDGTQLRADELRQLLCEGWSPCGALSNRKFQKAL